MEKPKTPEEILEPYEMFDTVANENDVKFILYDDALKAIKEYYAQFASDNASKNEKHFSISMKEATDLFRRRAEKEVGKVWKMTHIEFCNAVNDINKIFASKFTSANEGSVVVTDDMIEKEATDYCDCLVYEDTERYADYDYFKSCYVSACAWVRDQYEKK